MEGIFQINDDWNSNTKDAVQFKTTKGSITKGNRKSKAKKLNKDSENVKIIDKKNNKRTIESKINKSSEHIRKGKEKKLNRKKEYIKEALTKECRETVSLSTETKNKTNNFAERLRVSLKGGHFRFLNEKLYTTDGASAKRMFEQNPHDFTAYHEGYRHQVEQWPLNPLDRIIKYVKKAPHHFIVADFGCGEGRLAKSVPHKVYSIDLLSSNPDVIACDMAKTPLEDKCINIAVYCLSLMGTNIRDFMLEANRVLKLGSTVYIAEIASRFENVEKFIAKMATWGFDLTRKDLSHKLFYFFIFKKVKVIDKTQHLENYSLKPCLYKKR